MKYCWILAAALLLLAGCAAGVDKAPAAAGNGEITAVTLTSPVFGPGETIPARFSCKGEDLSPALEWQTPPAGTQSLALIMDDPDAPVGNWVHWVIYNIPPGESGLAEGASRSNGQPNLPEGTAQGSNSWKRGAYGGPCPPSGEHRYFFRLYALDIVIPAEGLDKAALLKEMDGHVLAQGELMGKFGK